MTDEEVLEQFEYCPSDEVWEQMVKEIDEYKKAKLLRQDNEKDNNK